MNFEWSLEFEKGQHAIGFFMLYSSEVRGIPVKALIQTFPQLPKSDHARIVHVSLFVEACAPELTDGLFHSVFDDIVEIVTGRESQIFDKASKLLEFLETQTLLFEKMPSFDYFTHGDYGIIRAEGKR